MIKLRQKHVDCQEKNEDHENSPLNIYELNRMFLGDCTEYIKNINTLEDSPWISSPDMLNWARKQSPNNLGKRQQEILLFLQRRYFIKDQPCFVKQSYIANQLGIDRSQVNRTLASLEKNGIILRIQWLYKGRRKNCLILPMVDALKPLFANDTLPDADFQRCHIQCDTLFCKPVESKGFSKSFLRYTNIIYINKLFNNNLVTINSILIHKKDLGQGMACSDEASHAGSVGKLQLTKTETTTNEKPLDEKALDKKPLEKKGVFMQKFALKRKQHSVHPYPATVSKLKLNGYRVEKLPVQEQVDYLNYVGFHHGIDLKSHFKIDPRVNFQRKSHWYLNRALALRQHFVRIIESGYELQWSFADSVIQLWNTTIKPYKRFSGINLKNKESKAYINAVIALSYCLFFKAGSDMGRIKKAILRLPYSRKSNRCPWNWKTNCKLEDFFMMDKENNPLDIYLHPNDDEFRRFCEQYRQRNPKNVKAYDYFKKIYTHEFFTDNEEKGNYICYANEFKIRKFLDNLIDDIRDGANTYDFSLVLPTKSKISGETQPALLHYYLSWLRTNAISHFNSRAAKFSTILQYDTWDEFVKKFMQIEMGYNDFWKKQDVKRGKGKK